MSLPINYNKIKYDNTTFKYKRRAFIKCLNN